MHVGMSVSVLGAWALVVYMHVCTVVSKQQGKSADFNRRQMYPINHQVIFDRKPFL